MFHILCFYILPIGDNNLFGVTSKICLLVRCWFEKRLLFFEGQCDTFVGDTGTVVRSLPGLSMSVMMQIFLLSKVVVTSVLTQWFNMTCVCFLHEINIVLIFVFILFAMYLFVTLKKYIMLL